MLLLVLFYALVYCCIAGYFCVFLNLYSWGYCELQNVSSCKIGVMKSPNRDGLTKSQKKKSDCRTCQTCLRVEGLFWLKKKKIASDDQHWAY